jgi:nitrite reductase/ring-hydroxylating ferredoxin subunit
MGKEGAVTDRTFACEVTDLDDGDTMTVQTDDEPVALYRIDGHFFATSDTCTHEKWSLGEEGDLDGFEVTCTLHNARFDARSGKALCFPATVNLNRYTTAVEDGKVYVLAAEVSP